MADILFELGCEELPPKALYGLSKALFDGVCAQLNEQGFAFAEDSRWFASPRRLAFLLRDVSEQLADQKVEKRGPSVAVAYDENGKPKPAASGFAKSVGAEVDDLQTLKTDKGEYLVYQVVEKGLNINDVLPGMIEQAIKQLPIPKPMRWGNHDYAFIRPVHWLVLMNGKDVIAMDLFGHQSDHKTKGHRFHHAGWLRIDSALDYKAVLQQADVMVDHLEREQLIKQQVNAEAEAVGGRALINQALLQEVASIVEKPVAVLGDFDSEFLKVPREALISSMESHQKYFPVENNQGELMPHFVALANIDSKQPELVKKGFEKVITPRLADARFFWEKDKARPLAENLPLLAKMTFEKSLGSYADKTDRIKHIMDWLAPKMGFSMKQGEQAARLMKCDLMSDMVGEFPDLQGLMGGYYAAAQGEDREVANAIRDQYLPRFSGDQLPENALGQALAMADKMDTLVGIFAVGKKPTGSKDPFALRRATLGIISILKDKQIQVSYTELIDYCFAVLAENSDLAAGEVAKTSVRQFFIERLRHFYINQGVAHDVFNAAHTLDATVLSDLDQRIQATEDFKQQDYAKSLIEANKRATNIVAKANVPAEQLEKVDVSLFDSPLETQLDEKIKVIAPKFTVLVDDKKYSEAYQLLATLAQPLDDYFEGVMVNVEDEKIRLNRLAQLTQVSRLTGSIADLSELVKS
ncbi:glycine--tRNA ligase subunit beta [Marinicella gelatinilytica]|uniref:glycine--tRNA ligase subunit beta n=1 Tax=Marinicella gelatinilytica TaxID=2996017 RepID=UPI002260E08C|nr:glycine--tRNA ligase subunit beta [Marinicella gelatinilytica]MCX7544418.1 glycine--tRNA ligase subunit beta [Marinicella gelatinilytica]